MIIVVCLSLCFAGASAGAERGSRLSQVNFDPHCDRVRAAKHATCDPPRILERRHGLAEIVERGTSVVAERRRVGCNCR